MTYAETIMASSPQAYYRLNEANGTSAADQMGGPVATLSGSPIAYHADGAIKGDSDTAITLDGLTGQMSLPPTLNPSLWSAISIEYWISVPGEGYQYVVVTSAGGPAIAYLNGYPATGGESGTPLLVSERLYVTGVPLPATLDEVAIYDYALSAAQVYAHWLASNARITPSHLTVQSARGKLTTVGSRGTITVKEE